MSEHRHRGPNHEGPAHTSPYGLSRLAPAIDLVDVARQIQEADRAVGHAAAGKLRVIADQIRALQAQAAQVLEQARTASALHHAECRFQKRIGHVYHLYRRASDPSRHYFSMLSPHEWSPPDEYVGSYRLEPDQGWTRAEDVAARDAEDARLLPLLALGAGDGSNGSNDGGA